MKSSIRLGAGSGFWGDSMDPAMELLDKRNICSAGLIAKTPAFYPLLLASVTPDRVKALYGDWITGQVKCYPMDNIEAMMVVMEGGLGGGATCTVRLDQTGKAMGHALLRLPVIET